MGASATYREAPIPASLWHQCPLCLGPGYLIPQVGARAHLLAAQRLVKCKAAVSRFPSGKQAFLAVRCIRVPVSPGPGKGTAAAALTVPKAQTEAAFLTPLQMSRQAQGGGVKSACRLPTCLLSPPFLPPPYTPRVSVLPAPASAPVWQWPGGHIQASEELKCWSPGQKCPLLLHRQKISLHRVRGGALMTKGVLPGTLTPPGGWKNCFKFRFLFCFP